MITWKIVETAAVGKRIPKSYKKCHDCGCDLTHYRFEIRFLDSKLRVCPACVLLEYLNKDTFLNKLAMWFKPKYRRDQLVEIIKSNEKKILIYELPVVLDSDPEIFGPIKYE